MIEIVGISVFVAVFALYVWAIKGTDDREWQRDREMHGIREDD